MSESQSSLEDELRHEDEEYRYAYAEDFLNTSVATQIRVLREQRGLTQEDLAQKIGTKQAGVSRLENVNYSAWKTETLRKIARALKVRLKITFETFGSLVDEADVFSRKNLERPSFEDDPRFHEREAASTKARKIVMIEGASIRGRLQEQNKRYNLLSFPILIKDGTDTTAQYTTVANYDPPMENAFFEEIVPQFQHVQVDDATDRRFLPQLARWIAFDERENKAS